MSIYQQTWEDLRARFDFPPQPPRWPPFQPWHHSFQPGEWAVLWGLLEFVRPQRMLEIGVQEGHAAAPILQGMADLRLYVGVDVPDTFSTVEAYHRQAPELVRGHLAMRDARFALLLLGGGTASLGGLLAPGQFDAVLIDADHTAAGVARDTALADQLIRPGGLIVWHDLETYPPVEKFLQQRPGTVWASGNIGWQFAE